MAASILVTGATGGLGQALLPLLLERGYSVSALYRSTHPEVPGVAWLQGDVTLLNLGLEEKPWHFDRVYHVAGLISLDDRDRLKLTEVNSMGTQMVVSFCQRNRIYRLFHVSTAYVDRMERGERPRNAYEQSKFWAEQWVRAATHDWGRCWRQFHHPLRATIFRPSILIPNPGLQVPRQGFLQLVWTIARVHRRAEMVRQRLEGVLHLPPLEPSFRIRGDPQGTLNVMSTDEVARAIASHSQPPQACEVVWLTNPTPPSLAQVSQWVGEILMLRIKFLSDFSPSPVEAAFQRLSRPFSPYLWGADLPSDLPGSEVDEGFIRRAVEGLFIPGTRV